MLLGSWGCRQDLGDVTPAGKSCVPIRLSRAPPPRASGRSLGGFPHSPCTPPPPNCPSQHPGTRPPALLSACPLYPLAPGLWQVPMLCCVGARGGGPPVKGSPPTPGLTAPGGLPWPLLQGAGWLAWKKWAAIHGYWPAQRRLALEDVRDFLRVQDPAPAPRSQPVKKDGAE